MKKLIASILAIAMVMSLATFQIFTTADAAEEPNGTVEWTYGKTNDVFTGASGDKKSKTVTYNGVTYESGNSLKMNSSGHLYITIPEGGGTLLIAAGCDKEPTLKLTPISSSGTAKTLTGKKSGSETDDAYEFTTEIEAGQWSIDQGDKGEPWIAYASFTPNTVIIEPTVTAPSVAKLQINDGETATDPVSFDVTISNYDDAYSFFAVSSDTNVATVAFDGPHMRDGDPNGVYTVTVTPQSSATDGSSATIYVGMAESGETPTTEDDAKKIDGVQTIAVTVASAPKIGSREDAQRNGTLYVPISGLGDLTALKGGDKLIIVLKDKDGQYKAIGYSGSDTWLYEITVGSDEYGKYLVVNASSNYLFSVDTGSDSQFVEDSDSRVKGKIKIGSQFFDPGSLPKAPFSSSTSLYVYSSGNGYYLRGSSGGEFLGLRDGNYVGDANEGEYVYVDIYIPVPTGSTPVYYHDYMGNIASTQYVTGDSFKPTVPPDVKINGKTYTLLGWSTDASKCNGTDNLLSEAESVNLYGFDKTANGNKGGYDLNADKQNLYNTYSLIKYDSEAVNSKDNTPRAGEFQSVNISGKDRIDLYPIYVCGGYITEATATGAGGTKIAISSSAALNTTTPRWLGSINVEIYNDGILVGGTAQTIYFYYNSDNMVDIQLVLSGGNGAYVINGVVAEQSGGSNGKGLSKKGNWLTPTGGMLDNVIGGTTVKVYMSTRYTAEFYLDGVKQTSSPFDKFNTEEYSTTASLDAFKDALKTGSGDGNYIVGTNSGEFTDFTQVPDSEGFLQENSSSDGSYNAGGQIVHGGKYLFGYLVKTYDHDFDIPETTATGKATTDLVNGDQWVLKGEKIGATNDFDVTENLAKADEGVFRFYAYTKGDLTVNKEVSGAGASTDKTFQFTITFTAPAGTSLPTSFTDAENKTITIPSDGTATFTVTAKKSVTITGLPTGTTYTITEGDAEGYTPVVKEQSGTIGMGSNTVTFTNDFSLSTGSLTITKVVDGDVKVSGTFTFKITPEDGVYIGKDHPVAGAKISDDGTYYTVTINYTEGSDNSVTINGLPVGSYKVEEQTSNLGGLYTPSVAPETVTVSQGAPASVTVTNTVKTGELNVTKKFELSPGLSAGSLPASADKDWNKKDVTFTVTFTLPSGIKEFTLQHGPDNTPVTINGTNSSFEFTLKNGGYENYRITGIPYGVGYEITEKSVGSSTNHYVATYSNDSGQIAAPSTDVTCTNTYHLVAVDCGALVIKKDVVGDTEQTSFKFKITFDGSGANKDAFDIFKTEQKLGEDNSQIYTLNLNDTAYLLIEVPYGTGYTVEEIFESGAKPTRIYPFFEESTKEEADVVSGETVRGVISSDYSNDTVHFVNMYLADLTITKVVEIDEYAQGPDPDKEYVFYFDFSASHNYEGLVVTYTINGVTKTITEPGTLEIRLKAGETATFHGIPVGASHIITEDVSTRGESVGITTTSGTVNEANASTSGEIIPGGVEITFTNKYTTLKTGSITVTKTVNGSGRQPAEGTKFSIEIELTDAAGNGLNGKYGDVTLTNGKVTVELKAGESVTLENVPYGTQYKVTEKNSQGADSVKITDAGSGTLKSESVTVTVTNTYIKTYGNLKITKNVSGLDADTDKDFTFTVILKDAEGNPLTGKTFNYDGSKTGTIKTGDTVTLKHGESIVIHDLPDGTQYTVTEVEDPEYTSAATENGSGKIVGNTSKIVTFTNTRKTGYLTVTKTVSGGNGVKVNRTYTFTVTSDRSFNGTIKLSNGNTVTFKNGTATLEIPVNGSEGSVTLQDLPTGTYTVTETTTGNFTTFYTPSSEVDVEGDKDTTVTVTNEVMTGSLRITKEFKLSPELQDRSPSSLPTDWNKKPVTFTVTFILPSNLTEFTASYGGKTKTINSSDTTVTITLENPDYECEITGIPYGVGYTVKEAAVGDATNHYVDTYEKNVDDKGVMSNVSTHVTCTNTFHLVPKGSGALVIKKEVVGETSQTEFTFEVKYGGETKTVTVKKGGYALLEIPAGTNYTVREVFRSDETRPTKIVPRFDSAEAGDVVNGETVSGVISKEFNNDTVIFSNQYLADLTLTKEIEAGDDVQGPDKDQEYIFHFDFSASPDYAGIVVTYTINGVTKTITEPGTLEIRLKAGESAVFHGIPVGASHTITEDVSTRGESVKIVTNSGDVDEANASTSGEIVSGGVKITFTNKSTTLKTGSITVTKTVNGSGRQPAEGTKFSIEIELTDAAGNGLNGKYGDVTLTNGKVTVELKAGESVTLENVPYGTLYKVTEKDSQGADSVKITDTGTGTLKSESVTVTVTNTYTKTYGDLKITKNVSGLDADMDREFTFTVTLKDAEGNLLTGKTFNYDGSKSGTIKTGDTVTLKHGESIVIRDFPDGTQYEVTETEDPEYTSAATEGGFGKIVGNTSKIVTFTNTRKTGYLTVTKTVSGGQDVKVNRTFTFTVTSDRSFNGTIRLSNGNTVTFKNGTATLEIQVNGTQASVTLQNLPTGKYTVTETTTGDFTTSYAPSYEVVVEGGKTAAVTVTNTMMTGSLKITKKFVLSPELQDRPTSSLPADWNTKPVTFTVTFILPSNLTEFTVTYGGKTKTINASDTTVTLSLENPDYDCEITGIPYGVGYTVEEAAVGDATNHYVDTYEKNVDDKGVMSNASAHVTCTNTFHLVPVGYGALVIKKEVVGETSQTEFTFEVEYGGETKTVTVKKGSYALLEIPAETAYTVREVFQSGETHPTKIVPRFDSAEAGDVVDGETVSGVISKEFNNDTVIFSNQYLADLTLTKEVEAGDDVQGPDKDQEYIFHFDFSASPDYAGIVVTYTINGVTKTITEPGTLEIRLKAGESAVFHGIPVGASHTITEDVSTRGESVGITTTSGTVDTASASTSGKIVSGGVEITFTNKYTTLKTGSITVTKTVNGSGRQPAEGTKFSIEIELTDAAGNGLNGKYGDVTFTNGKVTVELKAGESVTLENVPYGTLYKVTEKNSQGADSVKITETGTGTLKSESVTVTVTNTYTKTYGNLRIAKNVSGLDADTNREFTFTVVLKDAEGNPLTGKTFNYDGSKSGTIKTGDTVTLKHGESIVIHDLPDGTQYEVTEADDPEYTSAATENGSGKIVGNSSKIVTFTNTRKTGYLTVTKTVSGGQDVKVNRTFTFTVTSDRSFNGTIRLSNGNTVTFKNGTATLELSVTGTQASVTLQDLPTGKYTVTETTTGSFTTAYAPATANTSGVSVEDGRTAAVTVTNTVLVGKLTVAKEVTSNDAHSQAAAPDETFKITVTFTLPTYLKSFTVTAAANGRSDTYEVSNGTVLTLPLKKGQSVELSGIPYGVGYSVAEEFTKDNQANYEVTYTGSPSGTVSGPQASVTVHNKFYLMPENTGSIWVVKRVQGTFPSMSEAEFAFEVTFTRTDAVDEDVFNQFLETLGAEGNTYAFKIKNGENKVILGVPAGVEYTVREVTGAMRPAPANVVVEAAPGDEDARTQNGTVTGGALSAPWASGKIDGSRDVDGFTFYNQYLDDLVIEVLIGEENDVPEGTEFTFTLRFSGLEASQVSSLMRIDDANGTRGIAELLEDFMDDDTVTITLRKVAGDAGKLRATIYNVPLGVSHYEFVEIGGRGSTVTWDVASDRVEDPTHVGVDTDDQTFDQNHRYVTFKNVYVGGWLKLTKDVAGDDIPAVSQTYTFTVTPKGETEPVETFTLTGPGEKLLFLPAGEYIVTETVSGTSTSTSVKVGEGSAISGKTAELVLEEGETVAVTVTNTYTSGGTTPPELDTSDHFSYMMGYPDGTIRPNSPITRAEVASILFRLLTDGTRDAYKATANSFPDVNEGAWYNLAVSTLEKMGILNGYDDGTFRPDRPITRAEMAVIVGQFYGASGTTGNRNYYLDVGAQDWFSFFVEFVTEKGIMVGVGGGNFEPNRTLTRAEAMAVFNRILGRSPDRDSFDRVRNDPRYIVWPDNMNMDVWYYADVQEATQSHEYFLRPTGKELWTDALGMKEWEG